MSPAQTSPASTAVAPEAAASTAPAPVPVLTSTPKPSSSGAPARKYRSTPSGSSTVAVNSTTAPSSAVGPSPLSKLIVTVSAAVITTAVAIPLIVSCMVSDSDSDQVDAPDSSPDLLNRIVSWVDTTTSSEDEEENTSKAPPDNSSDFSVRHYCAAESL